MLVQKGMAQGSQNITSLLSVNSVVSKTTYQLKMLVHISLLTVAIPVNYTSEFQEHFEATT